MVKMCKTTNDADSSDGRKSGSSDSSGGRKSGRSEHSTSSKTRAKQTVMKDNGLSKKLKKKIECGNCTRVIPAGLHINIASKDYPKWWCKPCHNSSASYDRALKSRGVDVALFKKNKPIPYRNQVLRFRIAHAMDTEAPPDMDVDGCADLDDRKVRMTEFVDEHFGEESFITDDAVEYLDEVDFKKHFRERDVPKAKILEMWNAAIRDNDADKEKDDDGKWTVAVKVPKRKKRRQSVGTRKSLKGSTRNEDPDVADEFHADAMKKVSDGFRMSDASKSSLNVTFDFLKKGKSVRNRIEAAPSGQQKLPFDIASSAASYNTLDSDRKTVSSKNTASVIDLEEIPACNLVSARQRINSLAKSAASSFKAKKSSNYQLMLKLVEVLGDTHQDVLSVGVAALMKSLDDNLESLQECAKHTATWTSEGYEQEYIASCKAYNSACQASSALGTALATLKGVRQTEVKEATNNKRKVALKVRLSMNASLLTAQSFPPTLVTWLGDVCLGITEGSSGFKITAHHLASYDGSKNVVDRWSSPMHWDSDSTDPQVQPLDKYFEIATSLHKKGMKSIKKYFESNKDEPTSFGRLALKDDTCLYQADQAPNWVPLDFQTKACELSLASTSGHPLILGGRKFGFRGLGLNYPCLGLPHFLVGYQGEVVVCMIPVESIRRSGSTLADLMDMFTTMSPKAASDWMNTEHSRCLVKPGDVLFVPAGFVAWIITVSEEVSGTIMIPILCKPLLNKLKPDVRKMICKSVVANISHDLQKDCWKDDLGKHLTLWLESK